MILLTIYLLVGVSPGGRLWFYEGYVFANEEFFYRDLVVGDFGIGKILHLQLLT